MSLWEEGLFNEQSGQAGQGMFHVKRVAPHVLLIHPWITDFAAYNFWVRPLGLLSLASLLRQHGFRVTLIDCLDSVAAKKTYGDGKFRKTPLTKPVPLKSIPRNYSQYGVDEGDLLARFASLESPDVIGVTSGMTYWYPGVFRIIQLARERFESAPILLGGIYATLCYDHATRLAGADWVVKGRDEEQMLSLFSRLTGWEPVKTSPSDGGDRNAPAGHQLYPAFDLYAQPEFICMRTSRGCPFHCPYCASPILSGAFEQKDPMDVLREIEFWTARVGVRNIAFYDDALLVGAERFVVPLLRAWARKGIPCNFHVPNGLHVREISGEVADLLLQSGFRTIRLGLESSAEKLQQETGGKVNNQEFRDAVQSLRRAGYTGQEIGVYIMVGLPGQRTEEVEESIAFVQEAGARPILTEYSPIPGTPLFEKAVKMSPFDLQGEPLCQNNSLLPCRWEGLTIEDFRHLKGLLRKG